MAFFTGKGDSGMTKLFDTERGVRVSKASPIFECLGQLDELNAIVGWVRAACSDTFMIGEHSAREILREVQDHLFTLQAEVAGAPKTIPQESVENVSALIAAVEDSLPPVTTFLVPGGTEFSARLDMARAISRRAERRLVTLAESGERSVGEGSKAYANRLSSLFYALTRLENHTAGVVEEPPRYK